MHMPKRKPRIVSRAVAEKAARKRTVVGNPPSSSEPYGPKPKTKIEEIYDLIEAECSNGWWFADEDGRPWIEKGNIEEKGDNLYVVRFRCSVAAMHTPIAFNRVVERVCNQLKSGIRYFYRVCEERYTKNIALRYGDCAWIIYAGELEAGEDEDLDRDGFYDLEEVTEDIKCELTDETRRAFIEEVADFL